MKTKTPAVLNDETNYALDRYPPRSNASLASGGPNKLLTCEEVMEKTEPGSSQWCVVGEVTVINWNKWGSAWIKKTPWEQSNIETGCSKWLCSSHTLCFSRLGWVKCSATWSSTGFGYVVGQQSSLPTGVILSSARWFTRPIFSQIYFIPGL